MTLPTYRDFSDLLLTRTDSHYKWKWTSVGGNHGWKVTYLVNNQSAFFPAAGYRYDTARHEAGSYGAYWTSSLFEDNPSKAWIVGLTQIDIYTSIDERCTGLSIRAVKD